MALEGPLFHGDVGTVESASGISEDLIQLTPLNLRAQRGPPFFVLPPALQLRRSQGTLITVGGSNPGLSYQARREVAVNFTTD